MRPSCSSATFNWATSCSIRQAMSDSLGQHAPSLQSVSSTVCQVTSKAIKTILHSFPVLEGVVVAERRAAGSTVARCAATSGWSLRTDSCRSTWLRLRRQVQRHLLTSEPACRAMMNTRRRDLKRTDKRRAAPISSNKPKESLMTI